MCDGTVPLDVLLGSRWGYQRPSCVAADYSKTAKETEAVNSDVREMHLEEKANKRKACSAPSDAGV